MRGLKWMKLSLDIFDNRKIKYILLQENGAEIALIWIKLLCLAGKINDSGEIYFVKNKKCTDEMLASLLGVRRELFFEALSLFSELSMVERSTEGILKVKNWTAYQDNTKFGGMPCFEGAEREGRIADMTDEEKREYNREAKRRSREKERHAKGKSLSERCAGGEKKSSDKSQTGKSEVSKMSNECQKNDFDTSKNPPEIFITEESRIENKREDEIRKEEKINIQTHSLNNDFKEGIKEFSDFEFFEGDNECEPCDTDFGTEEENEEPTEEKQKHGFFQNVLLSEREYAELRHRHPDIADGLIEDFSLYLEGKGGSYANHLAVLLRWANNEYADKLRQKKQADAATRESAASVSNKAEKNTVGKAINSPKSSPDETKKGYPAASESGNPSGAKDEAYGFKKIPAPKEKHERYGNFDPEEAFRLALARSEEMFKNL